MPPIQQINEIVAKAHQRANNILHCFTSGNRDLLMRPPVLNSTTEKVQRRFTKRLHDLKSLTYTTNSGTHVTTSVSVRQGELGHWGDVVNFFEWP